MPATEDRIEVERLGGFAGFGGPGARLRSHGSLSLKGLLAAERTAVDALFTRHAAAAAKPAAAPGPATSADGFRYRITRQHGGSLQSIEVDEGEVPETLRDCVQDELI